MFSNLGVYFERSTHIFSKIVADVYVTIAIETPVARKLLLPALGNVVLQYQYAISASCQPQPALSSILYLFYGVSVE